MAIVLSHQFGIEYLRNLRSVALPRPDSMEDWLTAPSKGLQTIEDGLIDLASGSIKQSGGYPSRSGVLLSSKECNAILEEARMPTSSELDTITRQIPLLGNSHARCHVVTANPSARHTSSHVKAHQMQTALWDGALWRITDDVYVCSPELLFTQMAAFLPRPILVRLGLELCGGYCIQPASPLGFDNVYAVTTPEKLAQCISEMRLVIGKKQAIIAATRVLENSASPAESNVYIVLCFPRKEGGYGIVRPKLNGKVEIKLSNGEVHNRFCDFLWGLALAGEYYGEKSHSDKSAFLNDATRQGELAAQGIRIIPITADHTASITKMNRVAESIEQILGIRKRGLPQDFQERQLELHTMLFPWAH